MSQLKFGWSEISITPDKKVSLYGQFAERIAEYVEKPLTATAMAVECGDDQLIMCSCDLESVHDDLIADIRKNLAGNEYGIDPAKIIFNAIHTHCGPNHLNPANKNRASGFTVLRKLLEQNLQPGQKYRFIGLQIFCKLCIDPGDLLIKTAFQQNGILRCNIENLALFMDKILFPETGPFLLCEYLRNNRDSAEKSDLLIRVNNRFFIFKHPGKAPDAALIVRKAFGRILLSKRKLFSRLLAELFMLFIGNKPGIKILDIICHI